MAIVNVQGQTGVVVKAKAYYYTLSSTARVATDLVIPDIKQIVQVLWAYDQARRWPLYTDDDGITWRDQFNNTVYSFSYTWDSVQMPYYCKIHSIVGNVFRYACQQTMKLCVIGY